MILVTRKRTHPATIAYIERRIQEGKTRREANRCLKRYLARNLYRLLEHGPPLTDLTNIEASLAQPSVDDFERVILPKPPSAFPATGPGRSSSASRCGSCPWAARS